MSIAEKNELQGTYSAQFYHALWPYLVARNGIKKVDDEGYSWWALVSGGLAGVQGPEVLWSGTFIASSSLRPLALGLWWWGGEEANKSWV